MKVLLKNASVYAKGVFVKKDIAICDGIVKSDIKTENGNFGAVYDFSGCVIVPGLADVHVHLREPGFSYKETIKTGTLAAAGGGYTSVCSMPNLNPVPDSMENLEKQLEIIRKDACINVYPFGAITVGQQGETLSAMQEMCNDVVGFSDDGRGVQSEALMEQAMNEAKRLNKIISAHCEDNSLLNDGYIHDGEYAKTHNHKGICSESEYLPIKRDIEIVKRTGCKYHVCHISTKESVEIIRKAKADGVNITCETAPHYLVFCDADLIEDGRFKMNPPIRSDADRKALVEGLCDGTIDMIATDHAPHSAEEKSRGLEKSLMGVVGIETAFPVMYTHFVKTGIITLERLIELMSIMPCERFNIPCGIEDGKCANLTVFDLEKEYEINPEEFLSKGRATPFSGKKVFAKCLMTVANGDTVFENCGERKMKDA